METGTPEMAKSVLLWVQREEAQLLSRAAETLLRSSYQAKDEERLQLADRIIRQTGDTSQVLGSVLLLSETRSQPLLPEQILQREADYRSLMRQAGRVASTSLRLAGKGRRVLGTVKPEVRAAQSEALEVAVKALTELKAQLDAFGPAPGLPLLLRLSPGSFGRRLHYETAGAASIVFGMLAACVCGAAGLTVPWVFAGLVFGYLTSSALSAAAYVAHP